MRLVSAFFRTSLLAVASLALTASIVYAQTVKINEIRTDNTGNDSDEYFELIGPPGMSLSGYYYIVIGDAGTPKFCGVIESITNLSTWAIQSDGLLCLRNSAPAAPPVLTGYDGAVALTFENNDNVTHMLVKGFTGTSLQDLDGDDNGTLDITPWTSIEDAVGLYTGVAPNCTAGSEYIYCSTILGPDGSSVPGQVYRCSDTGAWVIGKFSPLGLTDTPGASNYSCAAPPPVFTSELRSPCVPQISEGAVVTARVRHATGADMYWMVNGGALTKVVMTNGGISGDTTTFTGNIPGQGVNGDKVEYYVRAFNATPDTTQDYTQGYFVGTVSMSLLHANDANGSAIYRYYGARVRGTITGAYGVFSTTNTDMYMQDGTGGINPFKYGTHTVQPQLGDDVTAEGTVDQYNGKLELDASASCDSLFLTINGGGSPPAPAVIAPAQMGESTEDQLLRMLNVTLIPGTDTAFVGNKSYKFYGAAHDTATLFIDADTNIPGMKIKSTTITSLTGLGWQYDSSSPYTSGYEFVPRNQTDIFFLGSTGVGDALFTARLRPCAPNPAARTARISFVVPGASGGGSVAARLGLYDVQGRLITRLVDGALAPGEHSATLDTQAAGLQSNGIYFYRLEVGGQILTRKMVVVR